MEINRNHLLQQSLSIESNEALEDTGSRLDLSEKSNAGTIWLVSKKAVPLIIAGFGNAFKPTITFAFINMYSNDQNVYAAVGLGIMLMNIFLRSYMTGFNNSMVTQISHAFGAGDYFQCGEILNKNKVICTVCMIPLMIPLFFIGEFLILIGQPVELSYMTQYFVRLSMAGFVAQLHYDIYRKYLNSIRQFSSHMPIPVITLFFHWLLCYIFIGHLKMELTGAGIVTLIQPIMNMILIYLVVIYGSGGRYVHGISLSSFTGWIEIIKEGIPSYFLQFVTTISLETLILVTGFISVQLVVANTAYINLFFLLYITIVGVQQSSGPMIGNKIGEKDFKGAMKLIHANIIFGMSFGFFVIIFILNFKTQVINFYVNDEEISKLMVIMLPYFCSTLYLTIYKDILIGIIIGLGLQSQTLKYTIASFILIYLPFLLIFTFLLDLPSEGPWISLTIVLFASVIYYHYLIHDYKQKTINLWIEDDKSEKQGFERADKIDYEDN